MTFSSCSSLTYSPVCNTIAHSYMRIKRGKISGSIIPPVLITLSLVFFWSSSLSQSNITGTKEFFFSTCTTAAATALWTPMTAVVATASTHRGTRVLFTNTTTTTTLLLVIVRWWIFRRAGRSSRWRLAEGTGWSVRKSYLTSTPPLVHVLQHVQNE